MRERHGSCADNNRRQPGAGLSPSIAVGGCSRSGGHAAAATAGGAEPILRVANQKGTAKSLMSASQALDGAPSRVVWNKFPSAQTLLEALGAGAVDLGAVGDAPFLSPTHDNPKLKVVQIYRSNSGGRSVALIVPNTSSIKTLADLKGRKIDTGKGSIAITSCCASWTEPV